MHVLSFILIICHQDCCTTVNWLNGRLTVLWATFMLRTNTPCDLPAYLLLAVSLIIQGQHLSIWFLCQMLINFQQNDSFMMPLPDLFMPKDVVLGWLNEGVVGSKDMTGRERRGQTFRHRSRPRAKWGILWVKWFAFFCINHLSRFFSHSEAWQTDLRVIQCLLSLPWWCRMWEVCKVMPGSELILICLRVFPEDVSSRWISGIPAVNLMINQPLKHFSDFHFTS